jgi:hypothetical protein
MMLLVALACGIPPLFSIAAHSTPTNHLGLILPPEIVQMIPAELIRALWNTGRRPLTLLFLSASEQRTQSQPTGSSLH